MSLKTKICRKKFFFWNFGFLKVRWQTEKLKIPLKRPASKDKIDGIICYSETRCFEESWVGVSRSVKIIRVFLPFSENQPPSSKEEGEYSRVISINYAADSKTVFQIRTVKLLLPLKCFLADQMKNAGLCISVDEHPINHHVLSWKTWYWTCWPDKSLDFLLYSEPEAGRTKCGSETHTWFFVV